MARLGRKSPRPWLPHVPRVVILRSSGRLEPIAAGHDFDQNSRVDTRLAGNKMAKRAASGRRHVSFRHNHKQAGRTVTSHLLPTFGRVDLAFAQGEGAWLTTTTGERYLDFTSGVAVNALGHAHPHIAAALAEQAAKLIHVSNLFRIPEGERLAERLCAASFADYVFFCNSGAEAMEGAIKC